MPSIVVRMKEAGALILAKTNMGEFASRYVGSAFGIIRNAYDPTRNPSGSSGGTGAGIAANFGMVGIGEDHRRLHPRTGRGPRAGRPAPHPAAGQPLRDDAGEPVQRTPSDR